MACLIHHAKSTGRDIELLNPAVINFCSAESIRDNFFIGAPFVGNIVLDPDLLKLYIENNDDDKKYFFKFQEQSEEFEISEKMYDALARAKVTAALNAKPLTINLSAIQKEGVSPFYCVGVADDEKADEDDVDKEEPRALPCNICAKKKNSVETQDKCERPNRPTRRRLKLKYPHRILD